MANQWYLFRNKSNQDIVVCETLLWKKNAPWKNKKIGFWYKVGKLILVKKFILWIENWNFIWDINEVLLNVITRNHWHFTMWCILNVPRSDMLFNDMVWRIEGMNDMRWYNIKCTNFAIMKLFQKKYIYIYVFEGFRFLHFVWLYFC